MIKEWIENIDENELLFLKNRYDTELKKFKKAYRNGLIVALITSSIICLILLLSYLLTPLFFKEEIENKTLEPITLEIVFLYSLISFFTITFVFSAAFGIGYLFQMFNLKKDIRDQAKIIELTTIVEKKYMPHNNSYHFVIRSRNKYTLEVDEEAYSFYNEGDEINLEYTKNAKIDLGYY